MELQRNEMAQNRERDEWKRAAGSATGLLNVCLALVTFLSEPNIERIQMLIYAGKRVRNRSQIPLQFAFGEYLRFCSIPRPTARRTLHSAKVRLRASPYAQDDTRGGGTLRSG